MHRTLLRVHARDATGEVRVLVVDDHPLVRSALSEVIAGEEGLTVVGECEDGSQVVDAAAQMRPDVRIIVLPAESPQRSTVAAVGADALVPESARPDALLSCLRAVAAGVAGCPYCL